MYRRVANTGILDLVIKIFPLSWLFLYGIIPYSKIRRGIKEYARCEETRTA